MVRTEANKNTEKEMREENTSVGNAQRKQRRGRRTTYSTRQVFQRHIQLNIINQ